MRLPAPLLPAPAAAGRAAAPADVGDLLAQLRHTEETLRLKERQLEAAAQEVQALRLRYYELFESSPDGYLVTDQYGIIQAANHAASALLGVRPEFLVGKPLGLLVADMDRGVFYQWLAKLRRLDGKEDPLATGWGELRLARTKGTPVCVAAAFAAANAENGVRIFRWCLRDVTWRKQVESALRMERDFANNLLEAAQAVILVVDPLGRILRSNAFIEGVSGHVLHELLEQDWADRLVAADDRPAAQDMLREALAYGVSRDVVLRLTTTAGVQRVLLWSARVLMSDVPMAPAVLVLGYDITDLQEAQRQALQAERLAAIGQMTATLAHESRNALQRSQACLERLHWRLRDKPEELDLLARAERALEDLVRLFEDVRSYAAPLSLERTWFSLAEAWREGWVQALTLFPDRDAHLGEIETGADLWCSADRFRLIQVFRNLFDNSLAAGGAVQPVRVMLRCQEASLADRPAVRVTVRDNGPGLNAEQRERVFEAFYTTKTRGSGLGMAIAKRIIEDHGGQISVGADEAPGAEFIIVLPRS